MKRWSCTALLLGTVLWSTPTIAQEAKDARKEKGTMEKGAPEEEGKDAQESQGDPAAEILGKMQVAVGQLTKLDTGKPTQTTQKKIVDQLDALIAQLEKESENSRGSRAGANPNKPLPDSMIKNGPGGSGSLHAARKEGKNWGELPPHERDRILQSMTEGFPPHYQRILERYYKRLAQEKPVADAGEPTNSGEKSVPSAKDDPIGKPDASSKTEQPADRKPAPRASAPVFHPLPVI